jgi:hypothetical protein
MFRMTCYYYRKAYYRAFFGMPPGCAVGPVPHDYGGETFLLVFQNLHRYTLYIAIALLPLLYLDAWNGLWWDGRPGFGVGTLLLTANAVLLSGYTFGCHAWRHLVGGKLNCFSCDGGAEARHGIWSRVSWLNERHQEFAWGSLICIALCDVYIRLVSMGAIPDVKHLARRHLDRRLPLIRPHRSRPRYRPLLRRIRTPWLSTSASSRPSTTT